MKGNSTNLGISVAHHVPVGMIPTTVRRRWHNAYEINQRAAPTAAHLKDEVEVEDWRPRGPRCGAFRCPSLSVWRHPPQSWRERAVHLSLLRFAVRRPGRDEPAQLSAVRRTGARVRRSASSEFYHWYTAERPKGDERRGGRQLLMGLPPNACRHTRSVPPSQSDSWLDSPAPPDTMLCEFPEPLRVSAPGRAMKQPAPFGRSAQPHLFPTTTATHAVHAHSPCVSTDAIRCCL